MSSLSRFITVLFGCLVLLVSSCATAVPLIRLPSGPVYIEVFQINIQNPDFKPHEQEGTPGLLSTIGSVARLASEVAASATGEPTLLQESMTGLQADMKALIAARSGFAMNEEIPPECNVVLDDQFFPTSFIFEGFPADGARLSVQTHISFPDKQGFTFGFNFIQAGFFQSRIHVTIQMELEDADGTVIWRDWETVTSREKMKIMKNWFVGLSGNPDIDLSLVHKTVSQAFERLLSRTF